MSSNRVVLADPAFRRLFVSRAISNIGNGVAPIALAFGVLALPGATPASLSIVLAAQAIPLVLMLPLGGVIADRIGRVRVVWMTDGMISLVIMVNAVLLATGHASVLLLSVTGAIAGVLNGMGYPAMAGLATDIVEDEHLQAANSMISISSNVGLITGAAIGGILVAAIGAGPTIGIDAVSFLVAAVLVFSIRHVGRPQDSGQTVIADLVHGWKVFISYRWIVVVVASFSLIVMVWRGSEEVLGPVLSLQQYNGPRGWSLVMAFQGIGLLIGGLMGARLAVKRPMLLGMLITFALPVWLMLLACRAWLPVAAAGALCWGIAIELFYVLWITVSQRNVPRESLSRVNSYDALGSMVFGPIGLAVAGPLVAAIGLQETFIAGAVIVIVCILATLLSPAVRNLRVDT